MSQNVTITICGVNGLDAATQLRNFFVALHPGNPIPTDAQAKAGVVAAKKPAAKAPVDEDEEEDEAPAPKAKAAAKKPVKKAPVDEDEEEEEPAPKPKAKAKAKPAVDEDEEEDEAPAKKKPAAKAAPAAALKDDGKDQPATVEGCRIMIRRLARAAGEEYALGVLAEFGVEGATKVPEKKMQKFIDRCQEVIDDPETLELEEAE